jgi:hypothetical protein
MYSLLLHFVKGWSELKLRNNIQQKPSNFFWFMLHQYRNVGGG